MSDRIVLSGMEFYARHGVMPEERVLGQRFAVDLEMEVNLAKAALADDPAVCVDYSAVYMLVKKVATQKSFRLIEALAEAVAQAVLSSFPVDRVKVRVAKPGAPLPGIFRDVAVEIVRPARGEKL